jgi:VWFA-related protein
VIAVVLLPCALAHAQEPPRFSGGTDLVVLHCVVTDSHGRAVHDLRPDAFSVFEDRLPQRVSVFSREDTPVTAGLIIDSSISMFAARDLVIAGATAFVEASHPGDEIFGIAFNEHVRAALPADAPFTSDPSLLRNALDHVIAARGRTALFDAIGAALDYAARGAHKRKVLVLISDGNDNASQATFADVLTRTQATNVVIYSVALKDSASGDAKPAVMKELARSTGGQFFAPARPAEMPGVLRSVAADIRQTYTIGYVPARPADGTFRHLRVSAKTADGHALVVRARGGYLASKRGKE